MSSVLHLTRLGGQLFTEGHTIVDIVDEDRDDGRHVVVTAVATHRHGSRVERPHWLASRSSSALWDTRPIERRLAGVPHGGPLEAARNRALADAMQRLAFAMSDEIARRSP